MKKVVSDRVGREFWGVMAGATEQPSTQKLAESSLSKKEKPIAIMQHPRKGTDPEYQKADKTKTSVSWFCPADEFWST